MPRCRRARRRSARPRQGLSRSALSQTIRQLEGRLGVRLLNRTTRSVAPTAAGSRLHERIAPMILEMDAAVAEAVPQGHCGRCINTLFGLSAIVSLLRGQGLQRS
jgi:DNA-binding transcriptional LysR family regulator